MKSYYELLKALDDIFLWTLNDTFVLGNVIIIVLVMFIVEGMYFLHSLCEYELTQIEINFKKKFCFH